MKITKPSWVHHDGKPIFSLDIHPDGSRFATGGQGKDSGRVTIWNLSPLIDVEYEKNENIPKMLCQLDNHLSCVNCVRWSHSGKFLASGGDDKLIMVWKKSGQTKLDENKAIIGVELWRCVGTLTGHSNDVLDLAWAPHDSWLASCSVDNTIIVWNMDKIPDIVARLIGHSALVKGVTWDPVGQYLASQSDDKSLRIWRTKDWKEQACITEPFKECGDMTHVLRLNWSPDGQYLVSAHASNSGGPTAKIIEIIERPIDVEKKSWSCEMDFVGHRKAVTCIKFNSNLLQRNPGTDGSKQTKYCTLATGSRDCALAIWCTAKKRPIVVINNLFLKSVLDLSWSRDGMQLVACSWDGTIAHLMFKQEELGVIVNEQEKMTTLESIYGKSFAAKHLNQTKIAPIMETPELLEFVPPTLSTPNSAKAATLTPARSDAPDIDRNKQTSISDVLQRAKQIETRTADGKRRVTPITVPRDLLDNQAPQTFSSSSVSKTKIIIEQRPEIVHVNTPSSELKTSRLTIAEMPPTPAATPAAFPTAMTEVTAPINNVAAKAMKRPPPLPAEASLKKATPSEQMNQHSVGRCGQCKNILEPLGIGLGTIARIKGCETDVIEVENSKTLERLCRVRREKRICGEKELEWELVLGKPVTSIRCNQKLTIMTCSDCTLHVVNTSTGCPMELPIRLPGMPACTVLSNNLVCVITVTGYLFVWDFSVKKMILKDFTLKHTLLSDGEECPSISSCEVLEDGTPLITLSSGKCYSYSQDLGWLLLSDMSSAIWKISHQNSLIRTASSTGDMKLPLKSLQAQIMRFPSLFNSKTSLSKNLPIQLCTSAFLQQQINAALALKSPLEYKVILLTLVKFYAQEGLLKPLRLIFEDLLGPVHSFNPNWSDSVLGLRKRDLLKEALSSVVQHVACQRLYVEFNDQLISVTDEAMEL